MRIEIDKDEYKNLTETQEEFRKTVKKLENIIIENIKLKDKLQTKEQECENLKWYLKEIRNEELLSLDIDYDEYETNCIDTEYTNIINLVEEALGE